MSYGQPDNYDDTIDISDIEDRIVYLVDRDESEDEDDELDEGEREELATLRDLFTEVEGSDGPLIRETYFETYARDMVIDCGYLPENLPDFISSNINWEGVADDLLVDYSESDFDGVTYLYR